MHRSGMVGGRRFEKTFCMGKKEEYLVKDGELFMHLLRSQERATCVSLLVYHVSDVSNAMVGKESTLLWMHLVL